MAGNAEAAIGDRSGLRDRSLPQKVKLFGLTALTAVVGVIVLAPVVVLMQASFLVPEGHETFAPGFSVQGWVAAFSERAILSALWNTLTLTAGHLIISLPLAVLISWLIGRTDMPGSAWFEFAFWVSFFLPPLSVLQGWILLLDPQYGLVNQSLRAFFPFQQLGPFDIYTWWGIVFAHLITTSISAKVMLMIPAFRNMDSSLEEVARISGDSTLKTLFKIVVPVMAPVIAVTTVMGLIRALEAFEIELVLGTPTGLKVYSTLIYDLVHAEPADYVRASAFGGLIMVLMVGLILLPGWITGGKKYTTLTGKGGSSLIPLGRWRWVAFGFTLSVVLMLTIIPICFLGISSVMTYFGFFEIEQPFTLGHWRAVLSDGIFNQTLLNTLELAFGTAIFTIVTTVLVAYAITRLNFPGRRLLDLLTWVPFTMPGILFSVAMLWLVLQTPFLRPLYGTTTLLVFTLGLSMLTVGSQIIKSSMLQMGDDLEHVSWTLGASWRATFMRIVVPLSIRAIIVVGLIGFISSARNVSHLALLSSSDNRPLALLQLEYMVEGRYEAASVIGAVVVIVTVGIAFLARAFGFRLGPTNR